jgi:hypothetical protein
VPALCQEVYAFHRSWWPRLSGEDADKLLDAHLRTLNGDNAPARLESIIWSLEAERVARKAREPGQLVGRRIEQANIRTQAGTSATCAVETAPFRQSEVLGNVGYGDKVTGADAMDIMSEVPGSLPGTVRRLIREVSGRWVGQNGKTKSRQHVVDEVTRLLRASDATRHAEKPVETIVVGNSTDSAKDDAAKLAALRREIGSKRSPTCA